MAFMSLSGPLFERWPSIRFDEVKRPNERLQRAKLCWRTECEVSSEMRKVKERNRIEPSLVELN